MLKIEGHGSWYTRIQEFFVLVSNLFKVWNHFKIILFNINILLNIKKIKPKTPKSITTM